MKQVCGTVGFGFEMSVAVDEAKLFVGPHNHAIHLRVAKTLKEYGVCGLRPDRVQDLSQELITEPSECLVIRANLTPILGVLFKYGID
jgi:hypothetical protein